MSGEGLRIIPAFLRYYLKTKKISPKTITGPIHICFCVCDHYEPGHGKPEPIKEKERVQILLDRYPQMADRHVDSYGNKPTRTWFIPPHYHRNYNLKQLTSLCEKGYGEIEMHLHHGKTKTDTAENLEATLKEIVRDYSQFGIFGTDASNQKTYGFIHGDWSLDNSRDDRYCGVNNELDILRNTGCFADFTFPSLNRANPEIINQVFYAVDDPARPKSYKTGYPVTFGKKQIKDSFMLIQGPLSIYPVFKDGHLHMFSPGSCHLGKSYPTNPRRIKLWIKRHIHVQGKPNWIFIKTHMHGGPEPEAVCGQAVEPILSYLESISGEKSNYRLHYVTARELYNIIKAAEAGVDAENPEAYRDYLIKPPIYDSSPDIEGASPLLKELVSKTYSG